MQRKLSLLAITVAGLVGAIFYFAFREPSEEEVGKPVIKPPTHDEPTAATNRQEQVRQPAKPKPPLGYEDGVEIVAQSVRTNSAGAVIEKLKLADGTTKMKIHPKPPLFENPCDQVIAMAISTKPGEAMPPLPDLAGIDRDFANSLLSPIVINDDDSDEVRLLKEQVIAVRKTLAEEVKNGGSVMEALLAHQEEMNRIYESRLEAILMMQEIQTEDGMEAAQAFADEVNRKFANENIPTIPVVGRGKKQ